MKCDILYTHSLHAIKNKVYGLRRINEYINIFSTRLQRLQLRLHDLIMRR